MATSPTTAQETGGGCHPMDGGKGEAQEVTQDMSTTTTSPSLLVVTTTMTASPSEFVEHEMNNYKKVHTFIHTYPPSPPPLLLLCIFLKFSRCLYIKVIFHYS